MKKTKKTFIALTLLFSFSFPSFALSWSGVIDNTTKFTENHDFSEPGLEQSNGVYLSLRTPPWGFGRCCRGRQKVFLPY